MNSADIVVVKLASRRRRVLTADSGLSDEHPRYSPDGRHIAWHSYNIKRAFNDQGRLTLFERGTGRARRLAPRLDRATTRLAWSPDSTALYMLIEDRGRQGLFRLSLRDAMPSPVAAGGAVSGFAVSRDGKRLVFDRASLSYPPALFAISQTGRDERALESPNRALLARVAIGATREFTKRFG